MVNRYATFSISFILHGLLVVLFFVSFKQPSVGDHSFHVTEAYLFSSNQNQTLHKSFEHRVETNKVKTKLPIQRHGKKAAHQVKQQLNKAAQSQQSQDHVQGVKSLLLEKLHDAIAKNLIYPSQAAFLSLSGVTVLSFTLAPSGIISEVRIKSGSGSSILDNAAVETLKKISPFLVARSCLHRSMSLSIAIRFES